MGQVSGAGKWGSGPPAATAAAAAAAAVTEARPQDKPDSSAPHPLDARGEDDAADVRVVLQLLQRGHELLQNREEGGVVVVGGGGLEERWREPEPLVC